MKLCPLCETDYPSNHTTCPRDGARLIESRQLEAGAVIRDKYRIVRYIGRGGMGTVYLADHIWLGEQRALKFISSDLSHDTKLLKRFRQEAQAAIKLRHPNIVEVADLDQAEDGSPYIAMEYVDGPGLRQAISAGPMWVERALNLAHGIGSGLAVAHAKGVVHRDVKPENILLEQRSGSPEIPKLLDFGIAAVKEGATGISRTRGLMLTPEYAAPEQWMGMRSDELDGRVDLYALGGVLYEMLVGRTALHSHNDDGWMYQHLQAQVVPPSHHRPELNSWPGLDSLVMRLLAKERDARPASAAEFLQQLDQVRAAHAKPQPASTPAKTILERKTQLETQQPRPTPPVPPSGQRNPITTPAPPSKRDAAPVEAPKLSHIPAAPARSRRWIAVVAVAVVIVVALAAAFSRGFLSTPVQTSSEPAGMSSGPGNDSATKTNTTAPIPEPPPAARLLFTAKDATGAVVPGTRIVARQDWVGDPRLGVKGGAVRDCSASGNGTCALENLKAGSYTVHASSPGFKTYEKSGIRVGASGDTSLMVSLKVGPEAIAPPVPVALDPTVIPGMLAGARAKHKTGDNAGAVAQYNAILKLDPENKAAGTEIDQVLKECSILGVSCGSRRE